MLLPNVPATGVSGLGKFLARVKVFMERWGNARKYFFAYDKDGAIAITTSWTDITYDSKPVHDTDAFTYFEGMVVARKKMRVFVSADVTMQVSGANRRYFQIRLAKDTGNGFAAIPGSLSGGSCDVSTEPYGYAGINMPVTLNEGDKIKVQGKSSHATEVTTSVGACRLYLRVEIYGD